MKTTSTDESWLAGARGRALVEAERQHVDGAVSRLFGRSLLQIGSWAPGLLSGGRHWRTGVLGPAGDVDVICDLGALPLAPRCVDAILLAHSLESAASAHRLLREVDKALSQRGQLLILGFNPLSWWGLRQRLWPQRPALPPQRRFLSRGRLHDWLRLLDYEVISIERFWLPGPARLKWLQSLLGIFAPVYLIHARKRRLPVNPIGRPIWRRAEADIRTARVPTTRLGARTPWRNDSGAA